MDDKLFGYSGLPGCCIVSRRDYEEGCSYRISCFTVGLFFLWCSLIECVYSMNYFQLGILILRKMGFGFPPKVGSVACVERKKNTYGVEE